MPVHAPDQPANVLPAGGVAVSVTTVPAAKLAWHVLPQLIAPVELRTEPELLTETFRVKPLVAAPPPPPPPDLTAVLNSAPTPLAPFIVTVQLPVPVHAPVQPANVLLLSAFAVRVTAEPVL